MNIVRTVICKLSPTPEQVSSIEATLKAFAAGCDFAADTARRLGSTNKVKVQADCYQELRSRFGLSANLAIRAIARACAALKVPSRMHSAFAPTSINYDQRIFSYHEWNWSFGLTLISGRAKIKASRGDRQKSLLKGRRPSSAVLVKRRDGGYFLHIQLTDAAPDPIEANGTIGVDMGVKNLATTDDGENFSGDAIGACRRKYSRIRKACQRTGAKSAKRKLQKVRKKESRFRANENHVISKRIVSKAKGTGCAIAVEDLTGIGDRTTVKKAERSRMKCWAFFQLRQFIAYKAFAEGIPVIPVDPRSTSRTCSECGHCEKANRKTRDEFACKNCGFELPADWNAARNIRDRAEVMRPNVGAVDAWGRIPVEATGKPVLASPRL